MMKGIWFDKIHSYSDLNLVLSEVNIPPATPKTNYIDIPGGDGSVDLTEALGEVRYNDREGSITFTVFPYEDFEVKKRQISNLLNGKRYKITLDKDPEYYWAGRCRIDEYASDKAIHQIVVGVTVAPYKLKHNQTKVVVPAGTNTLIEFHNARKTAIPTITASAETTIDTMNGGVYKLNAGTRKITNIVLKEGTTWMMVTSAADVTFTYQEGDL